MLESFLVGAQAILSPLNLLILVLGTTIGIVFGAIPGLSATMAIAIFLPITFVMNPVSGIVLLITLYIGGISGGLISAILTRIPGTPSSIATCFDGYPLTLKGEAPKALGVGIVYSFIGTIMSTIVLIFMAPWLARIAIRFGAHEYFSVAVFSLTMIAGLSGKSIAKGLISGVLGCMFATVGIDGIGNVQRFTLGITQLMTGFNILPVLIGLFAVSEIFITAEKAKEISKMDCIKVDLKGIKGFGFTWKEFLSQKWNMLISGLIGISIGILPGIGGGVANVLTYGVIKNRSKYPEKFGTGVIDGIVASETSNNAAIGGALVPMLSLGIPGDTVTAILLGGLTIMGVTPGPLMFTQHIEVVYAIFLTMITGSIAMLLIQFYGLRGFIALLKIPKHYLLPAIFLFCVIGAFGIGNRLFDVWTVLLFGVLGFVFYKMDIPAPPFILGFIIGPLMEINLRRGMMFSRGDFTPFITEPISVFFLLAAIVTITLAVRKNMKNSKTDTRATGGKTE
jgi:putative tricarboxylic transport membrane protein